ncbi:hypothetical protein Q7C_12 [Methylophaga frappieri]|uniref:Uncharacterized protein n=1 Tax=Methylophaga frappieri (strain ATCC BAA-2434 / DSM 25690 / JAM7) TaxID=754477 RepID=I1YE54_METFJ|nr:hypothetical protein Q7C_12 [Methylophaga frappieri]
MKEHEKKPHLRPLIRLNNTLPIQAEQAFLAGKTSLFAFVLSGRLLGSWF